MCKRPLLVSPKPSRINPDRMAIRTRESMSAIDLCKIQEAQLAAARDKLLQAVGNIIDNLKGIGGNIIEISEDTQELSGVNTQDEDSFFVKMEGHLAEVSSGLRQYG